MTPAVETAPAPAASPGSLEVDVAEIPLPEGVALEQMLDDEEAKAPPARAPAAPAPEVAQLAFKPGKARTATIELDFPFERDGAMVERITVRRLTTFEVGQLADLLPAGFDNFDVYAVMTGLPAPVLRGLDDADGDRVVTAAYDFLPRLFRPDAP